MHSKITITIDRQDEYETPERSEKRTGSAPGYAKAVRNQIAKATAKGDAKWGWCTVCVTAKIGPGDKRDKEGTAYLGNCSYEDAADFALNSGYLPQMIEEAIQEASKK